MPAATTATRRRRLAIPPVPGRPSAVANSDALANRSAGTFANAFATAASMWSGTSARTVRILVGRSERSLAITACAVGPVWGGSPVSIS